MKKILLFISAIILISCQDEKTETTAEVVVPYDLNSDTTYYTNEMKRYWLVMLKKGPDRDQDAEAAQKIQAAHLANIERLAKEGKIIMAGPMGSGSGELSGIFIMDCQDSTEVQRLVSTDTAIITGRLVFDYYPWWSAKGKFVFK